MRMHEGDCYRFLCELRYFPGDSGDLPDPALTGDEFSHELALMVFIATTSSDMKAEAPIMFAEFYNDPIGPLIVLTEEGTQMVHLIFPRPSEVLYRLAKWMAEAGRKNAA